jgi:hypothetical protein
VNPILHGVTSWLAGKAGLRLGGGRVQVVSTAVYALSPQAILLAGSLMSHTLVAACAAVVLLACTDCVLSRPPSASRVRSSALVGAGAALGVVATTRPLCACALLIALVAAMVYGRVSPRLAAPACVPLVACTLALGAYNARLTGSAFLFPQSAFFDEHLPPSNLPVFRYGPGCNDLGFGPTHGCEYSIRGGAHDPRNAISNTGDNLKAWLLLAGGGPLVFVAVALALRDGVERRARLVLLAPAPIVVFLYGLYWQSGTCYGARFYQAGLPALMLVAALGLCALRSPWVCGGILAVGIAWNAHALEQSGRELRNEYWGTDARFAELASRWDKPPALVMVAFPSRLEPMPSLYWTTPLIHDGKWLDSIRALGALGVNSPWLDGKVVFAKFHPGLVDELRVSFPGRSMWIYFMGSDRTKDRLEPYDRARLPLDEPDEHPRDNFDGYAYDGEERTLSGH